MSSVILLSSIINPGVFPGVRLTYPTTKSISFWRGLSLYDRTPLNRTLERIPDSRINSKSTGSNRCPVKTLTWFSRILSSLLEKYCSLIFSHKEELKKEVFRLSQNNFNNSSSEEYEVEAVTINSLYLLLSFIEAPKRIHKFKICVSDLCRHQFEEEYSKTQRPEKEIRGFEHSVQFVSNFLKGHKIFFINMGGNHG